MARLKQAYIQEQIPALMKEIHYRIVMGVPKIAIQKYGAEAIEIKFGQAAKGTQPVKKVKDIEAAINRQQLGDLVHPDRHVPAIQKAYKDGA